MTSGPILFYSAWPRGFHNVEAERKAEAFAEAGHDVVYVAGVGTRNPRPSSLAKVVDRLRRKVAPPEAVPGRDDRVRDGAILVLPPRQLGAVRTLNRRLVVRQLRTMIPDWSAATAWIRWPTPELVDALPVLAPRAVVYECVDAYHLTPGIDGRWLDRHERAERRLVELADTIVVPGEVLADRFRGRGRPVQVVPHGVELFPWSPRPEGRQVSIGFVGTLDYRLDTEVFRAVAAAHPDWSVRLIGPAPEGFDAGDYADLPNVTIEASVPHHDLPGVLAELDLGLLAYRDSPLVRAMTPVKSLELLAAGRPIVARRSPALERLGHVIAFADTPAEFVATIERVLASDSPALANARREVAATNTWRDRTDELVALVGGLTR